MALGYHIGVRKENLLWKKWRKTNHFSARWKVMRRLSAHLRLSAFFLMVRVTSWWLMNKAWRSKLTLSRVIHFKNEFFFNISAGQKYFAEFLKSEYSDENILFWQACEELKRERNAEKIEEKVRVIVRDPLKTLPVILACQPFELTEMTFLRLYILKIFALTFPMQSLLVSSVSIHVMRVMYVTLPAYLSTRISSNQI